VIISQTIIVLTKSVIVASLPDRTTYTLTDSTMITITVLGEKNLSCLIQETIYLVVHTEI